MNITEIIDLISLVLFSFYIGYRLGYKKSRK